ncbi:mid1-interacting protein 1A [Octopus bimaculoides]|uniref:Mid1-interacting protein 1 n=1 Tax=Octopus bimaculoides TaxID=37653 RepID=A0A0L8IA11_OCTBM|nr:mid1-interacting protein 1A [Octopus bimaculoides]|eukprot:XP_014782382.1 PREDICTED: mid1-interacting protein 1A-like isoform X1 [Octopus bimaculoides]
MNPSVRHMSISEERVTHQSIVSALSNFVTAVNHMDSTVMIPSRLRDMEVLQESNPIINSNSDPYHSYSAPPSPSASISSIPALSVNLKLKPHNQRRYSAEQSTLMGTGSDAKNLYNFYSMLKAIKQEVTCGNLEDDCLESPTEQDRDQDQEVDSTSTMDISDEDDCASVGSNSSGSEELPRNVANSFKFHLRGLFNLLQDFTETAKYLSHRYENEVGSSQANKILSQF